MRQAIGNWRHVFKLDPERLISDQALERVCLSGTDAIMVGGSSGVNYDNTYDLMERIRRYPVPVALEVSSDEVLVDGFDCYLIPVVLNTAKGEWITGRHQQVLKDAGSMLDWHKIIAEGYVIINEDSTAARVTEAQAPRSLPDLLAYARMADKLFRLPVLYVEYSGIYGNMDWVRKTRDVLEQARLFYGGGIDSPERAAEAARSAHTIVVGNAVYSNLEQALATVTAVQAISACG